MNYLGKMTNGFQYCYLGFLCIMITSQTTGQDNLLNHLLIAVNDRFDGRRRYSLWKWRVSIDIFIDHHLILCIGIVFFKNDLALPFFAKGQHGGDYFDHKLSASCTGQSNAEYGGACKPD